MQKVGIWYIIFLVIEVTKIYESIPSLEKQYVEFWEEVCNIESPTDNKEAIDKVGALFIKKAEDLGFKIEKCKQKVSGDAICITMNEEIAEKPICFSAHIDTVHPVGAFGYPPVKIKDGIIYGPGVTDCKGGAVAGLFAMHVLKNNGFNTRPVKLIIQTDEETSSKGSNKETIKFMAEKAKDSVGFINLEGLRNGGMVLKRKGILRFEIKVKGVSVHASSCVDGASAIRQAAHIIVELEKFKDALGITSNCGIIKGGTAANTVPSDCTMEFDFRFSNKLEYQTIKQKVKEVCENNAVKGTKTQYVLKSERVCMEETEKNLALYEKIEEIFEQNGLKRLGKTFSGGGSDAADMTAFDIPTVDGLGVYGSKIHSVDEYAQIPSLCQTVKRLCAIAVKIK